MRRFMLVAWPGKSSKDAFWVERIGHDKFICCDNPGLGGIVGKVETFWATEAENVADAKLKMEVGAGRFGYVNKGKCIHDANLTAGDRNSIDRTLAGILGQLSHEAVEFLVTIGGCIPSPSEKVVRQQLKLLITGTGA